MDRTGSAEVIERIVPRIAIALFCISLGFPWVVRDGIPAVTIPGWAVAGGCVNVTDYEGWMSTECSPMTIGPPIFVPGTDGMIVSGSAHHSRFALVGGIVAAAVGLRRRSRAWLLRGGAATGIASVYFGGLEAFTAGYACALFGSMMMITAGLSRRATGTLGVARPTVSAG